MLSLRDLARTYLDYYKSGGVKYSLQNDAAILRAIESLLQKQFETPQVLLSHIEAALAQQTRELKESVEWGRSVEQLKEALSEKSKTCGSKLVNCKGHRALTSVADPSNAPAPGTDPARTPGALPGEQCRHRCGRQYRRFHASPFGCRIQRVRIRAVAISLPKACRALRGRRKLHGL